MGFLDMANIRPTFKEPPKKKKVPKKKGERRSTSSTGSVGSINSVEGSASASANAIYQPYGDGSMSSDFMRGMPKSNLHGEDDVEDDLTTDEFSGIAEGHSLKMTPVADAEGEEEDEAVAAEPWAAVDEMTTPTSTATSGTTGTTSSEPETEMAPQQKPRSLLPPLRPEVTTPAPRSEAFNSVINFWRNRTKAFGGSVEPQDGTSDEVGAPRHFCEDIWAAYRDSGAREPEKDEALDERPGSAPLPELDHERHEQTETPQAPPSTSPEDEREPPSRWAEADPAGVAKPTDDGRSPVVCVPQARGRLYDEDEDGKADFGDVFDLGEILGIDLEQYGLGFTNNQLIVGAGVVLAILCYVGFLLFGGAKPLARGTAFRLRNVENGKCFTGKRFDPCHKGYNSFVLVVQPGTDYTSAGALLQETTSRKCLHVASQSSKRCLHIGSDSGATSFCMGDQSRALSLGSCTDKRAQGWQLMDGHLTNVLQGITVSKKAKGVSSEQDGDLARLQGVAVLSDVDGVEVAFSSFASLLK